MDAPTVYLVRACDYDEEAAAWTAARHAEHEWHSEHLARVLRGELYQEVK